jgi:short subunit fatty acids transporter
MPVFNVLQNFLSEKKLSFSFIKICKVEESFWLIYLKVLLNQKRVCIFFLKKDHFRKANLNLVNFIFIETGEISKKGKNL